MLYIDDIRYNRHMLLIVLSWMAVLSSVECPMFLPLIIQVDAGPAYIT
jgi:hypothetical protein